MKTKILLTFILGIMLLSTCSALLSTMDELPSTAKDINVQKYPAIEINDWLGLGKNLVKTQLETNTESCSDNCESQYEITTTEKMRLMDKIDFTRFYEDGRKVLWNIPIQVYYADKKIETIVQDYKTECSKVLNENSTLTNVCSQVKNGTHIEYSYNWLPYNFEEVKAGTYQVKVDGQKSSEMIIDWIPTIYGKELPWAIWGTGTNVLLYDNFSILNLTTWKNDSGWNVTEGYLSSGKNDGIYTNTNFSLNYSTIVGTNFTANIWWQTGFSYTFIWTPSQANIADGGIPNENLKIGLDGCSFLYPFACPSQSAWHTYTVLENLTGVDFYVDGVLTTNQTKSATQQAVKYSGYIKFLNGMEAGNIRVNDVSFNKRETSGTVTLNSPIANYKTISQTNTFNISATPTSPATLVNISLWTNLSTWGIKQTYWKVLNDKTGNKNWGTPQGGVILNGSEGVFDGVNDWVNISSIASNTIINTSTNFSISAFFYGVGNVTSLPVSIVYIGKGDQNPLGSMEFSSSNLTGGSVRCLASNSSYVSLATSGKVISWNTWYQATCVFVSNGTGITKILSYVDAINNANATGYLVGYESISHANTYKIGVSKNANNRYFNGSIDEVRIYNTSLSASQITDIYNYGRGHIGSAPTTTGLVAYYDFNDAVDNNSSTSIFSQNFTPDGNYLWGATACDSDGDCGVSENRTISIVPTVINSVSYNASTYETSSETYSINASGTLTTASLMYNGTEYAGTVAGEIATKSLTLPTSPGNKSFFWKLNGGITNSSTYNQNVRPINLTWCNYSSPINITYLNLSFKDESTNADMNGTIDTSTWSYWLGDGTVQKTLIYSNISAANPNHPFCFTPVDKSLNNNRSIQYSFTGYPQRRYDTSDILTNATLNKVIYLLSSSDGIYVTFQVIDGSGTIRSGVDVVAYRDIGGTSTIVEQGTTDAAGTVTFWLNPNYDHTFTFARASCTSATATLRPTQNQYTQAISCSDESSYYSSSGLDGITFLKYPTPGIIRPGNTTFFYQVYSATSNITQVKFDLINTTSYVLNTTTQTCGPRNCTVNLTYDVRDGMNIKGRFYVNIGSGLVLLEADAYWRAIATNVSDSGTIKEFLSNFRDLFFDWSDTSSTCGNYNTQITCSADLSCKWFSENGRNHCIPQDESNKLEYSRIVLIFLFLCIILAFFSKFTGYSQAYPGSLVYILTALIAIGSMAGGLSCANNQCVGLFQYSGLFNGNSYAAGFLNNYILAVLAIIYMSGHIFSTMRRYE